VTTSDDPRVVYSTGLGSAYFGDAVEALQVACEDESADLIVTSPPFALGRPKEYGNQPSATYVKWFQRFADEFWRVLKPTGSLVIDLGGAWEPGSPTKSLYAFELLVSLCRRPVKPFVLAQDVYWYNPARLPSPAQWVTIERVRLKDAVNTIWWLAKSPGVQADNSQVLREYTASMQRLLEKKDYNRGRRPSGHVIREGFTEDRGGAIPPNLLEVANTGNDQAYVAACRARNLKPHPARFPDDIPRFFIDFLTKPGDLVIDPFAGSNVTGKVAEVTGRRWLAIDVDEDYLRGSQTRFEGLQCKLPTAIGEVV
jgi:site-specific DNA-methyltransferase (cytosine-N4-specific)